MKCSITLLLLMLVLNKKKVSVLVNQNGYVHAVSIVS